MTAGQENIDQIYRLIRQAILDKDAVVATYNDYVREMCPHMIGTKKGRAKSLLYQFAGESSSGLEPDGSPDNWRCLFVDELSSVSVKKLMGRWHTARNYSRLQACVDRIDVEVVV
jgi:hypothetical protein